MFGLSTEDYHYIKEKLQRLERSGAVVWVFGSRSRGDHQKFSDLDLMIVGSEDYSREIGELNEVFEQSNLPIKIDIVQYSNFADEYKTSYENDKKKF